MAKPFNGTRKRRKKRITADYPLQADYQARQDEQEAKAKDFGF
jgi:hypothetical protein